MFYLRHKPRGLSKSILITVISVISNYASAMMTVIVPLYLFSILKSEELIGQISSISTFVGMFGTLSLGFLLSHFSRTFLFKAGMIIRLGAIGIFFTVAYFSDALIAKILFGIAGIIVPSILSLYLRDLTTPEDLPHQQGIYSAAINIAWLTGPMIAGFMMEFFGKNYGIVTNIFPILGNLGEESFKYTASFTIALGLFLLALIIFAWNKFVIKHPHLKETKKSKEINKHLHHSQLLNIKEYFQDTKRTLSFINIAFIAIWWVFIFTFFSILLKENGVTEKVIGIIIGLISLPNVLLEAFIGKFNEKVGGSINALIYGYILFFILIVLAFVVGMSNIYLFAGLIILSQVGVAITEPLQELQYFEGTNESNDGKFYVIHKIGGDIIYLITPIFIGMGITAFGINTVFQSVPYLFIPLFIILFFIKRNDIKKSRLKKKVKKEV